MSVNQKQAAIDAHSRQAAEFAASYAELVRDPYSSCFSYSRHRLDGFLERYLPERGDALRVLDLGCGIGHHMAALRARGFEVVGVDGSAQMLDVARSNNPGAELYEADVEDVPLQTASFDFVLCIEVLRYLPQPHACVSEMARVLKPGAICLTTATPLFNLNGYAVVNRLAVKLPVQRLVRLKQFFVTTPSLRRSFARAGFTDVRLHGVYLGPVNWVQRLAPSKLERFLRRWEHVDDAVADRPVFRDLANMVLVRGLRR